MKKSNDPYGLDHMKEKERLEEERSKKMEDAVVEIVNELRDIGDRLEKIEKKV